MHEITLETFYIINQIPKINRTHWNLPWMSCILKFRSLKISLETLERSFHRGEKTEISREVSWDIWNSPFVLDCVMHLQWISANPKRGGGRMWARGGDLTILNFFYQIPQGEWLMSIKSAKIAPPWGEKNLNKQYYNISSNQRLRSVGKRVRLCWRCNWCWEPLS